MKTAEGILRLQLPPVRGLREPYRSKFQMQRTTAYIHAHLEHALPLTELTAVAQTSLAHFVRLFKHATGHPQTSSAIP